MERHGVAGAVAWCVYVIVHIEILVFKASTILTRYVTRTTNRMWPPVRIG
jgi:hypothetical protein